MNLGEVSFRVTVGSKNDGIHHLSMAMDPSQTILKIKETISADEDIPVERLDVWCIEYENDPDQYQIDDNKALYQYFNSDMTISSVFVKELGFEPGSKNLGILICFF